MLAHRHPTAKTAAVGIVVEAIGLRNGIEKEKTDDQASYTTRV